LGPVLSTVLLCIVVALLPLRATYCLLPACYCENISNSTLFGVAQPANSFSAFFFNVVAIYLAYDYLYSRAIAAKAWWYNRTLEPLFYILFVNLLGAFSFAMHAIMTPFAERMDQISLQIFFNLLIVVSLTRQFSDSIWLFWTSFGVLEGLGIMLVFLVSDAIQLGLLGLQIAIFLGLEIRSQCFEEEETAPSEPKYILLAIAFMVSGIILWAVSQGEDACSPFDVLQGHAVWHVLCAFTTYFLWNYFSSRNPPSGYTKVLNVA
jgi:hypothetical protein